MYEILVTSHSYLRWLVLMLGLATTISAIMGKTSKAQFSDGDRKLGLFFMISCHTQLLLGLVLYFVSPFGAKAFEMGMKELMGNAMYRKIAVEHVFTMIIALVLITVGHSKNKRETNDAKKFNNALIFFGLGLLLILLGIPWNKVA